MPIPPEPPPSRYMPVFEDVFVVPEDMEQFADLVRKDLGAVEDAWNNVQEEMNQTASPNFPGGAAPVYHTSPYPQQVADATPGIREGQAFYEAYFMTIGAEMSLMKDLIRGLNTLHQAATMIHSDYNASDASNASGMEGAFAAYDRSSVLHALGEATDDIGGRIDDE